MIQLYVLFVLLIVAARSIEDAPSRFLSSCPKPICGNNTAGCLPCYKLTTTKGDTICAPAVDCDRFDACDESRSCPSPKLHCVVDSCCRRPICLPESLSSICSGSGDNNGTKGPDGVCYDNKNFKMKPILLTTFGSGIPLFSNASPSDFNFSTTYPQIYVLEYFYRGSFSFVNRIQHPSGFPLWHNGELDHTEGDIGGYMMLVDGKSTPGIFYESTVNNLCIGLQYEFSLFLANIHKDDHRTQPSVLLEIKSPTLQNRLLAKLSTGVILDMPSITWLKFELPFTALSSSVVLTMTSEATSDNGNDFVIDDIGLRVCTHTGPDFCSSK